MFLLSALRASPSPPSDLRPLDILLPAGGRPKLKGILSRLEGLEREVNALLIC